MKYLVLAACIGLVTAFVLVRAHREAAHFLAGLEFVTLEADVQLIAHAGGGTLDGRLSNSLEAIEESYASGIRWFEVDVSLTSDGRPILLHDWEQSWRYWFDGGIAFGIASWTASDRPVGFNAFMAARMKGDRTQLDMGSLCLWLRSRPQARFFLDPKDDHVATLVAVAETCQEGLSQLVWYTSDRETAAFAKQLGIGQIALSYYYGQLSLDEMNLEAGTGSYDYVDLGVHDFDLDQVREAVSWQIPVIAWTVNSAQTAQALADAGVTAIITDTLRPSRTTP
jgi:glycerophosphoryl diester phosphodiesterase